MTLLLERPLILVILSGLAYAAATIAMKLTSQAASVPLIGLVALLLGAAVLAEILALRRLALGVTYVMILALESLAVLGVAWVLGDGVSPRQLAGGAFVLLGTLVLST